MSRCRNENEHAYADGTFGVVDNITGSPVRPGGMDGHAAAWLCRGLNLDAGPGGRYSVGVVEGGILRRMTIDEYVRDDGALARWE